MKNCFKSMKLIIKNFPLLILIYLYITISSSIIALIPIHVIDYIIGSYPECSYIYVLILFGILFILSIILNVAYLYIDYVYLNIIPKLSVMLFKKLSQIDYDFHESPEFLNDYARALEMGADNIYNCAMSFFNLLVEIVSGLSVLGIIYILNKYTIIYVIIIGILYMILRFFMSKISNKFQKERQHFSRKTMYNNRIFTIKDSIADIKTTDIDQILLENNDKALDNVVALHKTIVSKRTFLAVLCDILVTILYPGLVLLLCYTTLEEIDIALFSSLTVAATTLSTKIRNIARNLGLLQDAIVEVNVPFNLMKMEGKIEINKGATFNEPFMSLDVNDISFAYLNNQNVLSNISLHIKKGQHIAILGVNGSGKTTLVKLLLRLYDVNQGHILINNKPYTDFKVSTIRNVIGAVFQNVEVYALTIAENILLHDLQNDEDKKLVDEALEFSGLYDYVYSLPDNINTEVTREFKQQGVVFSGGQLQKLAIARGYAQNYQLFILDEPSSALDPIAEANLYERMLQLGKDRTLIFISHRLTATVNADYIYLFDNGKIIEEGTHYELMMKNGKYKEMFTSQSLKYLGDKNEE